MAAPAKLTIRNPSLRLPEDGRAVVTRADSDRPVVEPPHARIAAEVVVEGPVLLDQEDDVLDVGEPRTAGDVRHRRHRLVQDRLPPDGRARRPP